VVVGFGGGQTAAVGLEGGDLTTVRLDPVDDLHGGHVVDAGIDAELVEEDHSLGSGLFVEGLHVVLDVRRGHHVLAHVDTGPGHLGVELPGQQAHRHVVGGDDLLQPLWLSGDVVGHGRTIGVPGDDVLGLAHGATRHRHRESTVEQVTHVCAHDQTGSENDDLLHDDSPCPELVLICPMREIRHRIGIV